MNQSKLLKKLAISLVCASALASGMALASPIGTTYTFNLTSTSVLQSGITLATVTLTQQTSNDVHVNVALISGAYFAGTGVGPAFAFNLLPTYGTSATTVNLSGAYSNTNFSVNPYAPVGNSAGDYNVTPDGLFTDAIDLSSTGASGQITGPLTFDVLTTLAAGISLTDFTVSSARNGGQPGGYEFGADLFYNNQTGSAGFFGTVPSDTGGGGGTGGRVPEPGSLALMGLGMLGLVSLRKRSKAK